MTNPHPHSPRTFDLFEEARHATERRTFQHVIETLEAKAEALEEQAHAIRSVTKNLIDPEYDAVCQAAPDAREIEEIAADLRGTLTPEKDDAPQSPDTPRSNQ